MHIVINFNIKNTSVLFMRARSERDEWENEKY